LEGMLDPRINVEAPDNLYAVQYFGDFGNKLGAVGVERALRAGISHLGGATGYRTEWRSSDAPLAENGVRYQRVSPTIVRPNFFEVLGARASQGRTFAVGDEETSATAVISDRLAIKLFPDQSPVGRMMTLDGVGYTVIGVVERSSMFPPLSGNMWILRPAATREVRINLLRLNRRVDPPKVEGELATIAAQLALAAGEKPGSTRFYGEGVVHRQFEIKQLHYALIGAVVAVLLVACANLANLQLARGLARGRELALRAAVGASRRQLVFHLATEGALLAFGGLLLGLVLTLWAVHVMKASLPPFVASYLIEPQTSWKMFAFAAGASLLCLFLAGIVPAMRISQVDPSTMLKTGSGTGANRANRKRYGVMVIAQIGLALPVLIAATMVFRGAIAMRGPKYTPANMYGYDTSPMVAASSTFFFDDKKSSVIRVASLASELVARAKTVPGILDAAAEVDERAEKRRVTVDDENGYVREEPAHQWTYGIVSPSYFRAFGRLIEKGRDFQDGEFDGRSVIISGPTARYLWGNRNPIGRAIKLGDAQSKQPWLKVVGVIGDMRDTFTIRKYNPDANYRMGELYRVITPQDSIALATSRFARITLYARARGSTELAAVRLQRGLRSVQGANNPGAVPLDQQFGRHLWRARQDFMAALFGTFALLGIGLVAIGVYGIVSHSIVERRRELAVRISLGAGARDILRSVLREGNVMILAGVAIGLFLTRDSVWWLGEFLSDENAGYDAPFMAVIAAGLFAIAVVAALFPAWRATRIDPVEALRHE
jgi:putative ABC transport system permease protein